MSGCQGLGWRGWEERGVTDSRVSGLLLGVMGIFWEERCWLHNIVSVPNVTELLT